MNTFNLALIFNDGNAVATIVCHNENKLDRQSIIYHASEGIAECAGKTMSPETFAHIVCKKIRENCDCQALVINADAATHISSETKAT